MMRIKHKQIESAKHHGRHRTQIEYSLCFLPVTELDFSVSYQLERGLWDMVGGVWLLRQNGSHAAP